MPLLGQRNALNVLLDLGAKLRALFAACAQQGLQVPFLEPSRSANVLVVRLAIMHKLDHQRVRHAKLELFP